jgi:hypothetical protein
MVGATDHGRNSAVQRPAGAPLVVLPLDEAQQGAVASMREKGQEALDRRRDAGADLGDAMSDIGDDRSRARRLFEVIRQAVKDFYVTFLSRLARWFDSLPIFPP